MYTHFKLDIAIIIYSYHTHELQDINLIFLLEVLSSGVI